MDQAYDLADILERIPGWLTSRGSGLPPPESIKAELKDYESRYPGSFNYSDFIDRYDPPSF